MFQIVFRGEDGGVSTGGDVLLTIPRQDLPEFPGVQLMRRLIIASGLGVLFCGTLACTQREEPIHGSVRERAGGAHMGGSLGYLEHRGRMHAVRDLADDDYRRRSDDGFLRSVNFRGIQADSFDRQGFESIHAPVDVLDAPPAPVFPEGIKP